MLRELHAGTEHDNDVDVITRALKGAEAIERQCIIDVQALGPDQDIESQAGRPAVPAFPRGDGVKGLLRVKAAASRRIVELARAEIEVVNLGIDQPVVVACNSQSNGCEFDGLEYVAEALIDPDVAVTYGQIASQARQPCVGNELEAPATALGCDHRRSIAAVRPGDGWQAGDRH